MALRATYDPEVQAITVDVNDAPIAGTVAYPDTNHLVDLDAEGAVVSLELLSPRRMRLPEMAKHFGFEDQLQVIASAIAAALPVTTGVTSREMIVVKGSVVMSSKLAVTDSTSGSSGDSELLKAAVAATS